MAETFLGRTFVGPDDAAEIAALYGGSRSSYLRRDLVEADETFAQAVPVALIRNGVGDVLRLKRLNGKKRRKIKIVIWAGGHVNAEDHSTEGDALRRCLVRELREELSLKVDATSLNLVAAVHETDKPRKARHVCLAYEWRMGESDGPVVTDGIEFERTDNGIFAPVGQLLGEVLDGTITEAWSASLIGNHLAKEQEIT